MAILNNLVVHGASRFLNTLYANDLTVGGTTTFSTLDVTGAATIAGTLTLSKTQDASGTADNKPALIVGNPTGGHLELDTNEIMAKASGTTVTDLYLNNNGGSVYIASNGRTYFGVGNKISAIDGTVTAVDYVGTNYTGTNATFDSGKITNLMVTDTLRSFKWDIQTIADLGGTFVVAPTLYCTANVATFNVTAISGNTITAAIYDTAISGATLGGATWAANSKVKLSGKIGGIVLGTCDGTLTSQMNTTSHTMNLTFTYPNQTDAPLSVKNYSASEVSGLTVMLATVGATNPVGIYMTSYDTNGYSHISLYGGTAVNPTVRIGNLQGLPAINGVTPSGWGLYTDHGYFNGLIVSNQGKIGNFTISNALYSSTHSAYNTNVDGVYLGDDYISVGKQGAAYLKADGTGKIGRYTFASNGEFTTTVSSNTAGMGNATYAFWAGATSANAANAPFSVTYAGAIKSTSGTIGGFQIDASSIRTANVAVTSNAKNSISLSSADFKRTIEGVERSGLRFAIGSKFGVDNNGTLYANGVNITNIDASNIKTGKLSADVIDAGSIDVSKLSVGAQTSLSNADTAYDQITNLEIGGRNLLWNTRHYNSENWYIAGGGTITDDPEEDVSVVNWGAVTTASWRHLRNYGADITSLPYSLVRNREVTFSFWIKLDTATQLTVDIVQVVFSCINKGTTSRAKYTGNILAGTYDSVATTEWRKISVTKTITDSIFTAGTGTIVPETDLFGIEIFNHSTLASHVKKVKLEFGNYATDWTPAPEDVDYAIDNIEIGGRNLLQNSAFTISDSIVSASHYFSRDFTYYSIWASDVISRNWLRANLKPSTKYTISFDYEVVSIESGITDARAQGIVASAGMGSLMIDNDISERTVGYKRHCTCSFTTPADVSGAIMYWYTFYSNSNKRACKDTIRISNLKFEYGDKPTDWTPAPEDVDYVIDSVEVGGRNLFKDSANLVSNWAKEGGSTVSDGVATINLSGSGSRRIYQMPAQGYWGIWEANTTYTVSVDAKVSASGILLSIEPYANSVSKKEVSPTTEWKRYSYTFTSGASTATGSCSFFGKNATSGYLYLRNPKLEKGDKATDWTPAPEDVASDIEDAAKTATSFITYISASDGIKVHNADDLTDYVQVNSNAISFFRNNSERTKIEDSAVRVGGIGSNIRNVYITNSAVQIRNNTSVLAEYGSTISLYQPGTTTKAVEITSTGVNVANGVLSGSKLETGEANRLYVEINQGVPSEAVDDTAKVKLSVEPGNIRAVTSNTAYARIRHAKFYGTGWDSRNINEYGWYMTPFVYCKQLFMDSGEAIGSNDFEHGLYNMRNDIMDSINESTSKLVTDNVISGINFVGSKRLGIATLTFVNFKFPANTDPSTTAYRIPYGTHKDYYPNEKLDFVSTYITNHTTNNWGRFYVTTDGYIRPVIKPTSDMAIRGTFVYTFY